MVVVSPTYFGVSAEISKISCICHHHGIPLIVDEAHGAHFSLSSNLPKSAAAQVPKDEAIYLSLQLAKNDMVTHSALRIFLVTRIKNYSKN